MWAENGDGVVTLVRDALGRIVSESRDGRTVESRYDVRGRRVARRIGEGLSAYAYDPLGALTELTLADLTPAGPGAATTIAFARDALGRETGRASGGFQLEQAFDPLGQIVRQRAGTGAHALERRWHWNRAFEPVSIADGLWGGTAYAYDANGQVGEARHGEGLPPPRADAGAGLLGLAGEQVEVERFAYEPTRDIAASDTALPGEPLGRALTPWLSSPGGKVKAARGADGSRILLTHDAQGRVVERRVERRGFRPKTWRYGWNALDRLVWCETPAGEVWRYGYDPFGRRVWKRRVGEAPGGTGVVRGETPAGEAYLWDGDVVAQAAPVFADGRVAWDRAVSWHHEPGTFRPVARERDGIVHHVVTDHLGTPRELYDADGRRAWSRSHRLWGGTRGLWRGEVANDGVVSLAGARAARGEADGDEADLCPIGFPGQWADNENGLSYNRFRYYDAEAGQYVSPDPIALDGGSRIYACTDSPTGSIDPYGLLDAPGTIKYPINPDIVPIPGSRATAIDRAWRLEQELVRITGDGTVDWTSAQKAELLNNGSVRGYTGHHINNVAQYQTWKGDPRNIRFLENGRGGGNGYNQHLYGNEGHRGSFQNLTEGRLIDRQSMIDRYRSAKGCG